MANKKEKRLKSPLRYPGGKSRVSGFLYDMFPYFEEYREPFVGGGSVFLETIQRKDGKCSFWINDLFFDLYIYWKKMQSNPDEVVDEVIRIRNSKENGREIFEELTNRNIEDEIVKAAEFFALNRMTFSGTTMSGGFSNEAFEKRFTKSSIDRCRSIHNILNGVEITNLDYSELIKKEGNNVFLFMDPPYFLGNVKSKLYGKDGNMHQNFDHERFFDDCKRCNHKWMITYNDCEVIRNAFKDYRIEELNFTYGMSNCKKGKEIIIRNY